MTDIPIHEIENLRDYVSGRQTFYRTTAAMQERHNCKDAAYVAKMQAEALGDVLTAIDRVMK